LYIVHRKLKSQGWWCDKTVIFYIRENDSFKKLWIFFHTWVAALPLSLCGRHTTLLTVVSEVLNLQGTWLSHVTASRTQDGDEQFVKYCSHQNYVVIIQEKKYTVYTWWNISWELYKLSFLNRIFFGGFHYIKWENPVR